MTAYRPVRRHWLQAKQNANEGCNSCASLAGLVLSFIARFILLMITFLANKLAEMFSLSERVNR